jgi:hypothetical protein
MPDPAYLSGATHVPPDDPLYPDSASLDALRALLSAFANTGGDFATPVSQLTLHHELRRRNQTPNVSAGLQLLSEVRDVQRLQRAFWLPAPTVVVQCLGFCIAVSGIPTQFLQEEFRTGLLSTGASRLLPETSSSTLEHARVPYQDWLGAPESTLFWAQAQLTTAKMIDPHGLVGMEIFRHWKSPNPRRWVPLDSQRPAELEILLARHRGNTGQTNHYLLKTHSGRCIGMAELPHNSDDVVRLQFALRAMNEDNAALFHEVVPSDGAVRLTCPALPNAERRLLSAVSRPYVNRTSGLWDAVIPLFAMEQMVTTLTALGLESRGRTT